MPEHAWERRSRGRPGRHPSCVKPRSDLATIGCGARATTRQQPGCTTSGFLSHKSFNNNDISADDKRACFLLTRDSATTHVVFRGDMTTYHVEQGESTREIRGNAATVAHFARRAKSEVRQTECLGGGGQHARETVQRFVSVDDPHAMHAAECGCHRRTPRCDQTHISPDDVLPERALREWRLRGRVRNTPSDWDAARRWRHRLLPRRS